MKKNPLTALLYFIKDHLAILIPLFLLAGFIKGYFFPIEPSAISNFIVIFVMILPVFINLDIKDGLKAVKEIKKRFLLVALFLNFIFYPLLACAIGWIFLRDQPAMWMGLILLSLIPTGSMSVNWTYFTKGNVLAVICIINLSLLLCLFYLPFIIPFISNKMVASEGININSLFILKDILTVILLPLILGLIIRTYIIKQLGRKIFEEIIPINSSISSLGILLICFIIMSYGRTQILLTKAELLITSILPLLIFYILVFALSHFAGRLFFNNEDAKALFYGTAPKYHVIILAIVLSAFQNYSFLNLILLMIIIAMVLQIPSLAFYAKFIIWYEKAQAAKQAIIENDLT